MKGMANAEVATVQQRLDDLSAILLVPRILMSKRYEQAVYRMRDLIESMTPVTKKEQVSLNTILFLKGDEIDYAIQNTHNVIGDVRPPQKYK